MGSRAAHKQTGGLEDANEQRISALDKNEETATMLMERLLSASQRRLSLQQKGKHDAPS